MLRRIASPETVIDVEDAGTTMRFLTAYFTVTHQHKILTGTERMKERPIGILVEALRTLGADIVYQEKEGYPPLAIKAFHGQQQNTLRIRGDISSQYISALMMIAPKLPQGLTLILEGKVGSRPYIDMTASLMKHFGVQADVQADRVIIPHQDYIAQPFTVESDWSGASYWFSWAALADNADLYLPRLHQQSLQGDSVIVQIMEKLGVKAQFENDLLHLSKTTSARELHWDFTHCPDLGQTVSVVCAATGVTGYFTGLESLRIKETDRIAALQNELRKIGADLIEQDAAHWVLQPSQHLPGAASFQTYKDHRMAMAFAPLATRMDVTLEDPAVVRKSYPNYWNDIKACGVAVMEA